MLARAATRRRQTAISLAIGATRLRVVRHGLAEAMILAALGGIGGLLIAYWGSSVLVAMVSGALPISLDVSPDVRVLAFTMLVSCATAVVFGLLRRCAPRESILCRRSRSAAALAAGFVFLCVARWS